MDTDDTKSQQQTPVVPEPQDPVVPAEPVVPPAPAEPPTTPFAEPEVEEPAIPEAPAEEPMVPVEEAPELPTTPSEGEEEETPGGSTTGTQMA